MIHLALGIKWRTWFFVGAIAWGCLAEILGYGGRIQLWQDPFSFTGFLMQISELNSFPAAGFLWILRKEG